MGVLNESLSVAIKTLTNATPSSRVEFLEEIVCLMNLRHANVRPGHGSRGFSYQSHLPGWPAVAELLMTYCSNARALAFPGCALLQAANGSICID